MKANGFLNGIAAAVLLTLPIGSVYAFSLFATHIAEVCGTTLQNAQYAFSLSIFFLGMGAAFFGPIVEKNPGKAGLIASVLYFFGMAFTGVGIHLASLPLVIFGYGFLNGLGQGIGYLSPVKALMMWFPKHKGLAGSVSIVSFGLGSTLCTFLANSLMPIIGLEKTFGAFAVIYLGMMSLGAFLLKKPDMPNQQLTAQSGDIDNFSYFKLFRDRMFWHSWLFMFLNISAGLALIGCSVSIFTDALIPKNAIVILMLLAGVFNGSFRLIFAWASDFLKTRIDIWFAISALSIAFLLAAGCIYPLIGAAILLINACYGGGFSSLPPVLADYYDTSRLSRIHGVVLSAWAFAGLVGNNVSMAIFNATGGFYWLIWLLAIVYSLNLVNVFFARKKFSRCILEKKSSQKIKSMTYG